MNQTQINERVQRILETKKRWGRLYRLTGKWQNFRKLYNSVYGDVDPLPEHDVEHDGEFRQVMDEVIAADKKYKISFTTEDI